MTEGLVDGDPRDEDDVEAAPDEAAPAEEEGTGEDVKNDVVEEPEAEATEGS